MQLYALKIKLNINKLYDAPKLLIKPKCDKTRKILPTFKTQSEKILTYIKKTRLTLKKRYRIKLDARRSVKGGKECS